MCDIFGGGGLQSSVFTKIDSNQLMTQEAPRQADSIQLMSQVPFQGIDSESTHDSTISPVIGSDRLMTQAAFQGFRAEV